MNVERKITLGSNLPEVAHRALGYLCTWSMPTEGGNGYDVLFIGNDSYVGENGLIAYYQDTKTGRSYTIGAVWRKDEETYSYHS